MKTMSLVFLGFLVAGNLSAYVPSPGPVPAAKPQADRDCTDLSGRWKGECVVAGKKVAVEMTIEHPSCQVITLDKRFIPVDGLVSETYSVPAQGGAPAYVINTSTTSHWENAEKRALKIAAHGYVKMLDESEIRPLAFDSRLQRKGDKLFSKYSTLNIEVECEYDVQK